MVEPEIRAWFSRWLPFKVVMWKLTQSWVLCTNAPVAATGPPFFMLMAEVKFSASTVAGQLVGGLEWNRGTSPDPLNPVGIQSLCFQWRLPPF